MKNLFKILLFFMFVSCSISFTSNSKKSEFFKVIELYIDEFSTIENKCNEKPYYKVYFENTENKTGFWIAAHLGKPGQVPPVEPGTSLPANPIEIKGVISVCNYPLVIYDYQNSDGHGLYDTASVSIDEMMSFNSIPDSCGNVKYPEAWFFEVTSDSIYIIKKRESFILK